MRKILIKRRVKEKIAQEILSRKNMGDFAVFIPSFFNCHGESEVQNTVFTFKKPAITPFAQRDFENFKKRTAF